MSSSTSPRLPWVDHLRTLMIVLVVNMHACVTYSHVGDWYVTSPHEPTLAAKIPFILWQAHLQSFFMGLLFFLAGYFAHGSLTRRGPGSFLRERSVRLGLPALFYMLVIHPFILLGINPWHADFPPVTQFYLRYLGSGRFLGSSGPLWFAVALWLFCVALVIGRAVMKTPAIPPAPSTGAAPTARQLWLFAAGLAVVTFLVRLVQPIGTSVLNLQFCFFAQYVAFFAAGLAAARRAWLPVLAASLPARRAGWIALVAGPLVLLALLIVGGKGGVETFQGGWHWQAAIFATWEQLTGVGLALGLLALFSRRCNREHPLLRWFADRSFAVYVLHAPVIIALYLVFRALPDNPYLLAALLTVTGLVATYALADLVRRVPGLRAIL